MLPDLARAAGFHRQAAKATTYVKVVLAGSLPVPIQLGEVCLNASGHWKDAQIRC